MGDRIDAVVIFVDFETRSRADLDTVGGRLYAEHPSTDVLCAVVHTPWGETHEWHPGLPMHAQADWDQALASWLGDAGGMACAHNAIGFDRHVWRRLGWPEPERWIDTAELARVAGFPEASLDFLGCELLGAPKDHEGNKLTVALSKPEAYYGAALVERLEAAKVAWKAANKGRLPTARLKAAIVDELDGLPDALRPAPAPVDPETLARVVAYCRSDVEIMVRLYNEHLHVWLDCDLPGLEAADRAVNDRGVVFDRELAALLLECDDAMRAAALKEAGPVGPDGERVPLESVEVSPQRLKKALAEMGVEIEDTTAPTLEDALKRPGLPERAALLIRARQAQASIAGGKLRAGLARCSSDGRLRDNTRYMGAHTGRWSGSGMQLQNTAGGDLIDVEATIARLRAGHLEAVYK